MDPLGLSLITLQLNERDRIWPGRPVARASLRRRLAAALRLIARRLEERERTARMRAVRAAGC